MELAWQLLNLLNNVGMERETHTIDAKNQSVGRLAVKVGILLRGKHKPHYAPHKDDGDFVVVQNVKDMRISGNKLGQKTFKRHSGYLGSLKETRLKDLMQKNPGEVLKKAVWGMMPKNKLRAHQIKRLKSE